MSDLLELAERCEKATGPDEQLNRDIYEWRVSQGFVPMRGQPGYPGFAFTASLDAAMTLAEGFGGEVTFFKDGTAKAFLWHPYPFAVDAKAATPALALCAAALRARASTETTNDRA